MGGSPVLPGWDTVMLAVPILALLAMVMFGLDELCASPRKREGKSRSFCGVDGRGRAVLSDPDGRPWRKKRVVTIEAKLFAVDGPQRTRVCSKDRSRTPYGPVIHGYIAEK
jgi:hypothetical protein